MCNKKHFSIKTKTSVCLFHWLPYLWATRTVPPKGSGSGITVRTSTSEERVVVIVVTMVVVVVVVGVSSARRLCLTLFGLQQVPAKVSNRRTTMVAVSFLLVLSETRGRGSKRESAVHGRRRRREGRRRRIHIVVVIVIGTVPIHHGVRGICFGVIHPTRARAHHVRPSATMMHHYSCWVSLTGLILLLCVIRE